MTRARQFLFVGALFLVMPHVAWANGELAIAFAPKKGQMDTYVQLELIRPADEAPTMAKAVMWQFETIVRGHFRPAVDSDYKKNSGAFAKCEVAVVQHDGFDPVFRAVCWSEILWKGDSGEESRGDFDTSEEVLAFVRDFSRKHFERVRQSILRRANGLTQLLT